MIARRKVFALFGAAPLAAKAAADQELARLSNISFSGNTCPAVQQSLGDDPSKAMQWAWKIPAMRSELESLFYEGARRVSVIDPDIAVHRSFSMAAKVAYQRQRNVANQVEWEVTHTSSWARLKNWQGNAMQKFLLG